MIGWSNNQIQFTSGFGLLCQIGMISEFDGAPPFWVAFAVVSPPVIGFLFFQPNEMRRSVVQFIQVCVSAWYFIVSSVLIALLWQFGKPWPEWWPMFLAGLGIGAIPCVIVFYRLFDFNTRDST